MNDVLERLRAANPVPRDLSTGWSTSVEGEATRADAEWPTNHGRDRRSRVLTAVAAGALVVVGVGSAFLFRADSESKPQTAESAIERLARGRWARLPAVSDPRFSPTTTLWTGRELLAFGHLRNTARWATYAYRSGSAWQRRAAPPVSVAPMRTVWTGSSVLVWNVGWAYDPARDEWRRMAPFPMDPGDQPNATWTGRVLVATSGAASGPPGASYDPRTDQWHVLPNAVPSPQANSTMRAVWDGRRVLFTMVLDRKAQAITYDPRRDAWAGSPPMTGMAYGPSDMFRSAPWVVQVVWRDAPDLRGYLEVARRRSGGGGFEQYAHPQICGVRTTPVPGGAVVFCSTRELAAVTADAKPLSGLPTPPVAIGPPVWTGHSLVAASTRGRILELSAAKR